MATTMAISRRQAGWRLSPGWRKATLLLHMLFGLGWMGADVVLGVLLVRARTTDDGAVAASSYLAVREFVPLVVPTLSVGVAVSGLLLGWGTKWGVLRYWWVAVKLVLSAVMVVLVFLSLVPDVNNLAKADGSMSADAVRDALGDAPTQLLFPPIVSFLMLGVAAVLSVYKPWRRTPWTRMPDRSE